MSLRRLVVVIDRSRVADGVDVVRDYGYGIPQTPDEVQMPPQQLFGFMVQSPPLGMQLPMSGGG